MKIKKMALLSTLFISNISLADSDMISWVISQDNNYAGFIESHNEDETHYFNYYKVSKENISLTWSIISPYEKSSCDASTMMFQGKKIGINSEEDSQIGCTYTVKSQKGRDFIIKEMMSNKSVTWNNNDVTTKDFTSSFNQIGKNEVL